MRLEARNITLNLLQSLHVLVQNRSMSGFWIDLHSLTLGHFVKTVNWLRKETFRIGIWTDTLKMQNIYRIFKITNLSPEIRIKTTWRGVQELFTIGFAWRHQREDFLALESHLQRAQLVRLIKKLEKSGCRYSPLALFVSSYCDGCQFCFNCSHAVNRTFDACIHAKNAVNLFRNLKFTN